ncbi:hypothetical protein TNCV_2779191 [Trichonephila clavipes]|nr:hypothetical protein TNCV_2779191 [Trichonephila clavipes]
MSPRRNEEKFQQLTEFEPGRIIGLREGGFSIAKQELVGSGIIPQSDVSLEAVDRRAPSNSNNWQWTTEGDVSVRRSKPD